MQPLSQQVVLTVSQLCPTLSEEQRVQLAAAVEGAVHAMSLDEEQAFRSAPVLASGSAILRLPLSSSCLGVLQAHILSMPLAMPVDMERLAHSLHGLMQMGCPVGPAEASEWEALLLRRWRAAAQPGRQQVRLFSILLWALRSVPQFAPSEELKGQLVEVAAKMDGPDHRAVLQVLQAAKGWGVGLPPETARWLERQAAASGAPGGKQRRESVRGGRPAAVGAGGRPGGRQK